MALMTAYLVTSKNAETFFNTIQNAKAPERFTAKFLKDLDFTSSNDRLYLGVLKGLGFLDEAGTPTERYYRFLDHSESGKVLAEAVQDAYSDLFALNKNAQDLTIEDVKGKFRSLTQGQKSENVISWMANTFKTLCELGDWSSVGIPAIEDEVSEEEGLKGDSFLPKPPDASRELELHYNIQLILPESRDPAVYDALFVSLRRHLF